MNIYFVRHGESEGNVKKLYQHTDTILSPLGIQQAQFVGKRFLSIPVDSIIASDAKRARHTADIIAKIIGKKVIYAPLLKEIKRPSEIVGLHQDDPKAVAVRAQIREHMTDHAWHYSDEENFFDARRRARKAIAIFEATQAENILVIMHGVFMKVLVFSLMTKDDLTPQLFRQLNDFFTTRNTGITWCSQKEDGTWYILTWNDHAHLG